MQNASPPMVRQPIFSLSRSQAPSATQIGAVVAKKVALATVVAMIDKCQKNRSPAKKTPDKMTARSMPRTDAASPPFSHAAQIARNGSARAQRQNALA